MSTSVKPRTRPPFIERDNYLSRDFLDKEKQHLWPRVWQIAGRLEEISKPGDFLTYNVADESVVVVRLVDGGVKAYHNVCPHRGRRLAEGCGRANQFRCRYHGWAFDLSGRNIHVQDRKDWEDTLDDEEIALHPVKVGLWGGFIWINMDPQSESLAEYLEAVPSFLDPFEYENLRFRWYLELKLPCNWKVALEAFMEGYHVATTHPQLLPVQGDDYTQSVAHGKHSQFGYFTAAAPLGGPSPRLKRTPPRDLRPGVIEFFRQMEEDFGAIFTDRDFEAAKKIMDIVPADALPEIAFSTAVELGRAAAEADGAGYPRNLDYEKLAAAGADWHIFPNCVTLPWFDGAVWYRSRPDGDNPDSCIFNIWSLKRYATGCEPELERKVIHDITGHKFGLIIDQDIANMNAVQQGMKSRAFRRAKPNPVQEVELTNFHQTLEAYVLGETPR
ncbi:MAG: aromatic ring-hydroxylating dioxygenase subunit alpha [Rhodospirillaceae bacterium]|nr:MAG: aromatic ring-hydroxylating dioxygenase subunit alpha [Rhodospirillaceae bacterium]